MADIKGLSVISKCIGCKGGVVVKDVVDIKGTRVAGVKGNDVKTVGDGAGLGGV